MLLGADVVRQLSGQHLSWCSLHLKHFFQLFCISKWNWDHGRKQALGVVKYSVCCKALCWHCMGFSFFFKQHSILKPFMLRRVKKDVISELTRKTEITVHCKLSSRQQAFYQAIKNKISLAELFDSNRHLNEKKILNLMNIVIQLRKVFDLSRYTHTHKDLFLNN